MRWLVLFIFLIPNIAMASDRPSLEKLVDEVLAETKSGLLCMIAFDPMFRPSQTYNEHSKPQAVEMVRKMQSDGKEFSFSLNELQYMHTRLYARIAEQAFAESKLDKFLKEQKEQKKTKNTRLRPKSKTVPIMETLEAKMSIYATHLRSNVIPKLQANPQFLASEIQKCVLRYGLVD